MKLSNFSINRPITTLMIVVCILVLGWISLPDLSSPKEAESASAKGERARNRSAALHSIPLEYLPEISSNRLHIRVPYTSSSPKEVEERITIPIEEAVATVKDVDEIRGRSSSRESSVTVTFKPDTDMDLASAWVRDRLDHVKADLPEDVERIRIFHWQSTDLSVVDLQVSCDGDKEELQDAVKEIQRRIERLEGVAGVEVRGMEERKVLIDLDLERMTSHRVDSYALRQALQRNNINVSAGYIVEGGRRYAVRSLGEFRTVEDIASLGLKGGRVKLKDIADVRFDYPEKEHYQQVDGRDAIVLNVMKSSSANLINVARVVQGEVGAIRREMAHKYPRLGLKINIYRDRSADILNSLQNLRNAGLTGGVFVIIVLFFFMRSVRSTLIISLAIPLSVFCTLCLMYLSIRLGGSRLTLNVVSMAGLMLSLGMLVDPAVVVLENIFRLRQDEGLAAVSAARLGTSNVAVAVLAATATTMCVFVPLIFFTTGMLAIYLYDFGVTICFALFSSLLVSMTLVPLLASRIMARGLRQKAWWLRKLTAGYARLLKITLRFRWVFVLAVVPLAFFSFYLYTSLPQERGRHRARLVPIRVDTPRSYTVEQTRDLFQRLVKALEPYRKELEIDVVSANFDRRGGVMRIKLIEGDAARRDTGDLKEEIKAKLPVIPGVRYRAGRLWGMGGEEVGISVEIIGKSADTLGRLAEELRERLEAIPFAKDADTSLEAGNEEIRAVVNREKAQQYGLSPLRVARGVNAALSARAVSKLKRRDREVDISVQLAEEDRLNLDQLKNLEFENPNAENVTFDRLADFKRVKGPSRLERQDKRAIVRVTANVDKGQQFMARRAIEAVMKDFPLPPAYSWRFAEDRRHRREESEMYFGEILAVAITYMIMAALFESFAHPFVILLSIPFAITGVAFSFHFIGIPVDYLTHIGIFLLIGLVVNNAIVLIDYINRLRRSGMDRATAIVQGGSHRLRPILMTTLTTVLGLLPMVWPLLLPIMTGLVDAWMPGFIGGAYHWLTGLGEKWLPSMFGPLQGRDRSWAPIGLVLISGLLTSTILTLIVMPTIYAIVDDLAAWLKKTLLGIAPA
ncbi:MAG: efflux RND transporter permease subunit [Planctomycetes bacterium]|nr:efflux RND transporter permease subunit [Planctomycetota bacterium]